MSAPHTDLDRQKRRHRGPLIGIIVVLLFVGAIFTLFLFNVLGPAADPAPEEVDLPVSPTPPQVITPGPQPDPSLPQGSIAPVPAPQGN